MLAFSVSPYRNEASIFSPPWGTVTLHFQHVILCAFNAMNIPENPFNRKSWTASLPLGRLHPGRILADREASFTQLLPHIRGLSKDTGSTFPKGLFLLFTLDSNFIALWHFHLGWLTPFPNIHFYKMLWDIARRQGSNNVTPHTSVGKLDTRWAESRKAVTWLWHSPGGTPAISAVICGLKGWLWSWLLGNYGPYTSGHSSLNCGVGQPFIH